MSEGRVQDLAPLVAGSTSWCCRSVDWLPLSLWADHGVCGWWYHSTACWPVEELNMSLSWTQCQNENPADGAEGCRKEGTRVPTAEVDQKHDGSLGASKLQATWCLFPDQRLLCHVMHRSQPQRYTSKVQVFCWVLHGCHSLSADYDLKWETCTTPVGKRCCPFVLGFGS